MSLIPSKFLAPEGAHYISVDDRKIDINQIRQWLTLCDTNHSMTCHHHLEDYIVDTGSLLTLIDVHQWCLVIPTAPARYAALSYVWGDIPGSLMTTTRNLERLFIPGSLELPETNSRIPKTILDAIAFTKMMGLRYLWVDRLCIVQDNIRHFNVQLQRMAAIYANACFTIIAASGEDANYGLRGIGDQALHRVRKQTYYEFSSNVKLLLEPRVESMQNPPCWYTRAWTFQERALSRRTIVFWNNTVYWQCRSNTWREDIKATPEAGTWSYPHQPSAWPFYALTLHPWPDLVQYFYLVEGYNTRRLSFEEDALRAFTAVINAFSNSFPHGFLFGIPEFFFDIGLLWSTDYRLIRRKDFPSWSWLGWSGKTSFYPMQQAWKHEWRTRTSLEVLPIVKWTKVRDEDQGRELIDNSYHLYQRMTNTSKKGLPQGWTIIKDGRFVHPSIEGKEFKHPIPLTTGIAAPSPNIWSPLLPLRTTKSIMYLGIACSQSEENSVVQTCLRIEIQDSSGVRTGVIESQFTTETEYNQGGPCELIAISEACAWRAEEVEDDVPAFQLFREMDAFSELENEEIYKFYNVLWIEWEDGIAYRKALGRVFKEAWDRQDLEETDIVLG